VRTVMTPAPKVIDAQATTATAQALMDELSVRHLPVMDRDRLVGVLSERDLRGARAFLDHAPGELGPVVGDLCSRNLLVVGPDDPLDDAANAMADRKVGAALVVRGVELVGIMTCIDLCRGLTTLVGKLRALSDAQA
ncbi:MAG: CBS domain-containing protein, partial [Nannocystaceae bacterium]